MGMFHEMSLVQMIDYFMTKNIREDGWSLADVRDHYDFDSRHEQRVAMILYAETVSEMLIHRAARYTRSNMAVPKPDFAEFWSRSDLDIEARWEQWKKDHPTEGE